MPHPENRPAPGTPPLAPETLPETFTDPSAPVTWTVSDVNISTVSVVMEAIQELGVETFVPMDGQDALPDDQIAVYLGCAQKLFADGSLENYGIPSVIFQILGIESGCRLGGGYGEKPEWVAIAERRLRHELPGIILGVSFREDNPADFGFSTRRPLYVLEVDFRNDHLSPSCLPS